jgi:hypothetical protein
MQFLERRGNWTNASVSVLVFLLTLEPVFVWGIKRGPCRKNQATKLLWPLCTLEEAFTLRLPRDHSILCVGRHHIIFLTLC